MSSDEALAELLCYLKAAGYRFTAVTPDTHAIVLARTATTEMSLGDIFGWNRSFQPDDLDADLLRILRTADAVETSNGKLRSKVRVASVGKNLLLHSTFPTEADDAVFLGPDTYRFISFLQSGLRELRSSNWLVDMGAGSGAGGIAAAGFCDARRLTLVDVNPAALRFATINAAVAGVRIETVLGGDVPPGADIIIANPPYMMDAETRMYRDGGDLFGGALALEWVGQALGTLVRGGTMLLYTGAAFVRGEAPFIVALQTACAEANAALKIEEIDPDVFGDELRKPLYAEVERIAAIGAVITTAEAR